MADPLASASAVFLTPPILLSMLGFIYHFTFRPFQHPEWEVPGIGWLSLSLLTVGCVGFLR